MDFVEKGRPNVQPRLRIEPAVDNPYTPRQFLERRGRVEDDNVPKERKWQEQCRTWEKKRTQWRTSFWVTFWVGVVLLIVVIVLAVLYNNAQNEIDRLRAQLTSTTNGNVDVLTSPPLGLQRCPAPRAGGPAEIVNGCQPVPAPPPAMAPVPVAAAAVVPVFGPPSCPQAANGGVNHAFQKARHRMGRRC